MLSSMSTKAENSNPASRQVVGNKPSGRCKRTRTCNFLSQTKDQIWYQWRHRRVSERNIATMYGVPREAIESVLFERIASAT